MANFSIDSIRPNKASQEIETCLQANKVSDVIHQSLLSYLLYSGSINNNLDGISYQDILDGNIKVTQNTIRTVQDVLNEELWEKLKKVGQHYSVEDLESAAMFITRKIDTLGGTLQHGPTTPVSLRRIIKELLNIQPEDRVADVGCGSGNVMFYLADYEPQASYFGYEISMNIAAIAESWAEMSRAKIQVVCQDVFLLPENEQFDKIFIHVPPGSRFQKHNGRAEEYLNQFREKCPQLYKGTTLEWAFVDALCNRLTKGGKVVAFLPYGCLSNSCEDSARQYFIENGLIEKAIILPNRIQKITYKAALVVFSHDNRQIHLIDATPVLEQAPHSHIVSEESIDAIIDAINRKTEVGRQVSSDDLRTKGYVMNPELYKKKAEDTVLFSDVVKSVTRGVRCNLDELRDWESKTPTPIRYLTVPNIHDGIIDENLPYLCPDKIPKKFPKFYIKRNSLLLPRNPPLKFAIASIPEGEQILLGNNLYAIELDEEKINPFYLQAFLESAQGAAMFENVAVGTYIRALTIERFREIHVPLPALEDQQRIADECQGILKKITDAQKALKSATNQLRHVFDVTD